MANHEQLHALADWLGTSWTREQEQQFLRFAEYLASEGVAAGGIGPHEVPRMMDRHICDSLVYLTAIEADSTTVVDIGSGVGLPGVPIAIARPDLDVTLLDRSQRRTDLANRAIRILRLENVTVQTGDVSRTKGLWDMVAFRASLGLDAATQAFRAMTTTNGVGVFGVSRLAETPQIADPPQGISFDLRKEAAEVLDSPSWLLRMRHL